MRLAYTYSLKRAINPGNDMRSDMNVVARAKKDLKNRKKQKYVEQDLGTVPIPAKDFLYRQLEI